MMTLPNPNHDPYREQFDRFYVELMKQTPYGEADWYRLVTNVKRLNARLALWLAEVDDDIGEVVDNRLEEEWQE